MKTVSYVHALKDAQVNYQGLADQLNGGKITLEDTAKKFGVTESRMIRKLRNMGYHKMGKFFVYNGRCD